MKEDNMIMENKTERAVRIIWYSFCVIIAAISIRRFGIGGRVFTAGLFLLSLALAGAEDIRTMHIPDWITAACGAAGLLSIPFFPEISLAGRCLGAFGVSGLLLCITLLAPGSFGGGDVKLTAASGIFLGLEGNLRAFALAVFMAGAFCVWMLFRGKLGRRDRIAFGPFLCAGMMLQAAGSGYL